MNRYVKSLLARTMMIGFGSTLLFAQSSSAGLEFEAKVRGGVTTGLKNELGDDKVLGFGVSGTYRFGGDSSVFAELNYIYLPGADRDVMRSSTFDGRTLSPSSSSHNVKNLAEGFSVRGGYRGKLFGTPLFWQAGLILDRLKGRQEVIGTLRPSGTTSAQYEGLAYTPTSTKLVPNAFVGVRWNLNPNFALEFNAAGVGYSYVNWVPAWYTGTTAKVETQTRRGVAFEAVFALKL